jgi:hypothetical protein
MYVIGKQTAVMILMTLRIALIGKEPSTLKMEVARSSERSVNFYHTAQRYIPEDSSLHRENIFGKVYPSKQPSSKIPNLSLPPIGHRASQRSLSNLVHHQTTEVHFFQSQLDQL